MIDLVGLTDHDLLVVVVQMVLGVVHVLALQQFFKPFFKDSQDSVPFEHFLTKFVLSCYSL